MDENTCELEIVKCNIREQVLDQLDLTMDCPDEVLISCINDKLVDYPSYISFKDKVKIKKEIFNSLRKYDVLSELPVFNWFGLHTAICYYLRHVLCAARYVTILVELLLVGCGDCRLLSVTGH